MIESEDSFRDWFCDQLKDAGSFNRVEPNPTKGGREGIPDISYCVRSPFFKDDHVDGRYGWIEFKWGYSKKKIEVRPQQMRWFREQNRNHGRPWLIWGSNKMWGMITGKTIAGLKVTKLDGGMAYALSSFTYSFEKVNWKQVQFLLYFPTRIEDARAIK